MISSSPLLAVLTFICLQVFTVDLISACSISVVLGVLHFTVNKFLPSKIKSSRPTVRRCALLIYSYLKRCTNSSMIILLSKTAMMIILGRVLKLLRPMCTKWIVDSLAIERRFCWDLICLAMVLKFLDLSGIMFALRRSVITWLNKTVFIEMQTDLINHILRLPHAYLVDKSTGDISSRMNRGIRCMKRFAINTLFNIAPNLLDISIACVYLANTASLYIFGAFAITAVAIVCTTLAVVNMQHAYYQKRSNAEDAAESIVTDALNHFESVKYFGRQNLEGRRFGKAALQLLDTWRDTQNITTLETTAQALILSISMLLGCLTIAHKIVSEDLSVGNYIMFIHYLQNLYGPIEMIGYSIINMDSAIGGMDGMFEILDHPVEDPREFSQEFVDGVEVSGDVAFGNVSFSYDGSRQILKNVSFTVPRGNLLAIVGPTGSGKSTIIKLLHRFYQPDSGIISVGGVDIKELPLHRLRGAMAIVPQDSDLFNNTIGYNIRYSRPHCQIGDVVEASKTAQVHDFITGLEEGYGSRIGKNGLKMSGGERQRLSIARAVLKQSEFIFMDEATSSLDSCTEKDIQKALNGASTGKTAIFIAHRLSTIAHADNILVLKQGEVVEQGTHEALLNVGGTYAKMWRLQAEDPNSTLRQRSASLTTKYD